MKSIPPVQDSRPPQEEHKHRVVLADIDLPFWSICAMFIKIAFAAIPAVVIIGLVFLALYAIAAGFVGAMHGK